jgi:hypothetical protein
MFRKVENGLGEWRMVKKKGLERSRKFRMVEKV